MIRPTFLSFETAKKALNASQLGLDTVGHNLANISTPGYTRQRVDQVSISSGGYKSKYYAYGPQLPGQGSEVIGINQIRDPYLDKRYRSETATCGEYYTISDDLAEIGKIFDEIMSTGTHEKISEFLTALGKLAGQADSKEYATVVRNMAEQLANVINRNSTSLDSVDNQIRSELDKTLSDVNTILEQIAVLNVKIKEDNFYGNPSNELNDQRNLLLDQLAELIDIDVERIPYEVTKGEYIEQIRVTIKGTGNINKNIDPIVLVDSGEYYGLYSENVVDANGVDTGEVRIKYMDGESHMDIGVYHEDGTKSNDITRYLYTGSIKAHVSVINGKGTYATNGENGFRGIPYYRQSLDDFAATLAGMMNEMNELAVYGPNGPYVDADGNVVTISRPLFTSSDGGPITAANICVTDEWLKNPLYIETAKKNNALYVDEDGWLYFPEDEDGNPMEITGIKISQIAGINKDGQLLDHDGNLLDKDGNPTNNVDDAVDITMLQRAMTEATTYYPFDIWDYVELATGTHHNSIVIKSGNGYIYPDYDSSNGIGLLPTDPITPNDVEWGIDGYLYYKGTSNAVQYTVNGTPYKITKDDLFKTNSGTPGTDYKVGDPTPNVLLPGDLANDNLLAITDMFKDSSMVYSKYGVGNGFTGSFQEYLVNMQADVALDKELADTNLNAAVNVLLGLADSRDGLSGVSMDEEGVNMMTYQNYYNAAARYMTVLDEALGTIIQGMGVVGR